MGSFLVQNTILINSDYGFNHSLKSEDPTCHFLVYQWQKSRMVSLTPHKIIINNMANVYSIAKVSVLLW